MSTWLNDDQRAFLISKYPPFAEAQNNGKTQRFWGPVYEIWWNRWPIDISLAKDLTEANQAKAIAKLQKAKEKVRQSDL